MDKPDIAQRGRDGYDMVGAVVGVVQQTVYAAIPLSVHRVQVLGDLQAWHHAQHGIHYVAVGHDIGSLGKREQEEGKEWERVCEWGWNGLRCDSHWTQDIQPGNSNHQDNDAWVIAQSLTAQQAPHQELAQNGNYSGADQGLVECKTH